MSPPPVSAMLGRDGAARRVLGAAALGLLALAASCSSDETAPAAESRETTRQDIALTSAEPRQLLPGTTIVVSGGPFVPEFLGESTLSLEGDLDGSRVELKLPARFVDYDRLEVDWPGAEALGLPASASTWAASARVLATSQADGLLHRSTALPVTWAIASALTPRLDEAADAVIFVNDPVYITGEGLLLGGGEGATYAVVEGCFAEQGSSDCVPVGPVEVPVSPEAPFDRAHGRFAFSPHIAGILPGQFEGTVALRNRHGALAGSAVEDSGASAIANPIVEPVIGAISPAAASLGQYVDVSGGGFVGPPPGSADPADGTTILELSGQFTPPGGAPAAVQLSLLPQLEHGQLVRYVVAEDDSLGQLVDLRHTTGTFTGTVRPVVLFGDDTVIGAEESVTLSIAPPRQVVYLQYLPAYVESLRHFGLRALDAPIRARIEAVVRRDYQGIGVDLRTEEPRDFALYSVVEVGGPDPNGIGLLGYDNSPGKDRGNQRLYDRIGGVNAVTQLDGYPGYGGVFVASLFGYSLHPGALATMVEGADPAFDGLFDAFRPDRGGSPAGAADLGSLVVPETGQSCPAKGRQAQVACAVWALGSLVGSTISHEVAHSLGLADPEGESFHNPGDAPGRLMDGGTARPFLERAEIGGQGPGVFCDADYAYLRAILPTAEPEPALVRPTCE